MCTGVQVNNLQLQEDTIKAHIIHIFLKIIIFTEKVEEGVEEKKGKRAVQALRGIIWYKNLTKKQKQKKY